MSLNIIRLSADMAFNVFQLENECFFDPYSLSSLRKDFSDERNICIGAFENDKLIAYLICTTVLDEAELQRIAVTSSLRGKGIASSLMSHLIDECLSLNISYIFLEVRESNVSARKLYEKHNFVQTGLRKKYYRDNGENAVLYTLFVDGR